MEYELREHTADVAVAATGETLESVFAAVAEGFVAASLESVPDGGERFSVSVTAESREALLFDYLDELVYLRDVRDELPVNHEVAAIDGPASDPSSSEGGGGDEPNDVADDLDAWSLEATARGVSLADVAAREVKAVTYSEMRLEPTDSGWEAYVVFDM
ncbi:archease [Natrarchaeobaculum aegyptiacum]|uniref:Protein archease n=1 Tax=Natrarchaeobaculum aegyptiacum TaxID=745377 RepID=A0A2Z2HV40_9EURY|nr:archease [Natrarchaeobaculum aegyptiacum]ARS91166.1 protein archease [Natrarchaeobaculum aegyptiacum]